MTWTRTDRAAIGLYLLLAAVLVLRVEPSAAQPHDSWIVYLPAAMALRAGDLAAFREVVSVGFAPRPALLPVLIAGLSALTGVDERLAGLLVAASSAFAALALAHLILRRWLSPLESLAACAVLASGPCFLRMSVTVIPDMACAAACLGLLLAVLSDRPGMAALAFALALGARNNLSTVLPGMMLYLWSLRRRRPRALLLGAAAAIVGAVLADGTYRGWVQPHARLGDLPATVWHPSIFVPGAEDWAFLDRLRPREPLQYWLLLQRGLIGLPADLVRTAFSDEGVRSAAFGVSVVLGAAALMVLAYRYRRALLTWALLLLVAGLFGPLAHFHWETRYWLLLQAVLSLAGSAVLLRALRSVRWRYLSVLAPAGAILAVVASSHDLLQTLPTRHGEADYRYPPAEQDAEQLLGIMLARSDRRPLRVFGCEAITFQILTYARYRAHRGDFECVDHVFGRPVSWAEVDLMVAGEGPPWSGDREAATIQHIQAHGQQLLRFGGIFEADHQALWANTLGTSSTAPLLRSVLEARSPERITFTSSASDPAWRAEASGELRLDTPDGSHRWRELRGPTLALGRGDVAVAQVELAPVKKLRHGVALGFDDPRVPGEEGGLSFKRYIDARPYFTAAYLCAADRCAPHLRLLASSGEARGSLRARVLELKVWRAVYP